MLDLIRDNLHWIIIVVGAYLLFRRGGTSFSVGGIFSGVSNALKGLGPVLIVLIIAVAVIVVLRPNFFGFLSQAFGPGQQVSQAEADVKSYALDPLVTNYKNWQSDPAKAVAESLESKYKLETTQNNANIAAAEAERICRLPDGHPDRVPWEKAKMDPCQSSLPPGIQVAQKTIADADWDKAGNSMSRPLGVPPDGASNWIRDIWNLPIFALALGGAVLALVVLRLALKIVS